jgi:hypothetical protein
MAKPNRLAEIANQRGEQIHEMIPRAIEETGSIFQAAVSLGVSPISVPNRLKRNGYTVEQKLVTVVTRDEVTHV